MKEATLQASSAIGHIIKLGPKILGIMDEMIMFPITLKDLLFQEICFGTSKMVNEKITISYVVKFIAVVA